MRLELTISCDVELVSGDDFRWETNREDAFEFRQNGSSASIRQTKRSGTTFVGGVVIGDVYQGRSRGSVIQSVSGGQNVSIIDGEVWVNGRRVDQSSRNDENFVSPPPEPRLKVTLPAGVDVTVKTSGSSNLYGNAEIGRLSVATSGSTDIDLMAHSADLRTSGSSDINLMLTGGGLRSQFSGSTDLTVVEVSNG